jgi:hypothetical protein
LIEIGFDYLSDRRRWDILSMTRWGDLQRQRDVHSTATTYDNLRQRQLAGTSGQVNVLASSGGLRAMTRELDPQHKQKRETLRMVGPLVLGAGIIFTLIGLGSFFSSFGTFEFPRYFWCAFIGLPLIGVGISICRFAFLGAVSRYVADEVAPVGKDVVNYMADGTKDAIRDVASAVGEGLRGGASANPQRVVRCHKCNADNQVSANFCQGCGASLAKTKPCAACGESNDPDAKFCDNCGASFVDA